MAEGYDAGELEFEPWVLPDQRGRVPLRALLLSAAALLGPLAASVLLPQASGDETALLIWLPALIPAFLLTYYRGWRGASVALAAAMATLALSQAVVSAIGASPPGPGVLLMVILVSFAVAFAVGWFGELLHRARRDALEVALRDPLTGLPNRGHLRLFMDAAFGWAERGGHFTVVLFDLDRFKAVNDRHGHAAGDEALIAFAQILKAHTRRSDLSTRFGGEEFACVLTGPGGPQGALVFAERVRRAVRERTFPWGTVTVSAGIAGYRTGLESPSLLLAEADRALYRAKAEGRDRAVISAESAAGPGEPAHLPPAETLPPPDARREGGALRRGEAPGPRVLVVADDGIVREGVSRILSRAGFRTATARDGVEALERLEGRTPPDVVLADLVMPRMGGLTLADRVREANPEVRVLLLSSDLGSGAAPTAAGAGISMLAKPVAPEALVSAVRALALQSAPGVPQAGGGT